MKHRAARATLGDLHTATPWLWLYCSIGALDEMVLAQSLGDEDRQAPRDEKGNRCAGATVGRDHAPHLG
jgi:hypothetical protein